MAGRVTRNGFNQADLVDVLRRIRNHGHFTGTLPGLAPATAPADIQITAGAVRWAGEVDGVAVMKAAADPVIDLPGAFGLVNTAALQSTVVLIQVNSAGTYSLKQGPVVTGTSSDTTQTLPVPVPDAGVTVVGHIVIAGTAHIWGTTALTAAMLKDGDPYRLPNVNQFGYGSVGLES